MKNYTKPSLLFQEQIELLKLRGLVIVDNDKALHYLSNISYYRLSAYMYPFLSDKESHLFKTNTAFEQVISLYNFDRKLRILIMDEIERIEVAFRTQLTYHLSHKNGAFWFQDSSLFHNYGQYLENLHSIHSIKKDSGEVFIKHFKQHYSEPLPPSWMSMEIISFGLLLRIYNNLNATGEKNNIAKHFGIKETVFASWMHCFVYIRNICAHHCRLWNRELSIKPMLPKKVTQEWIKNTNIGHDKLYLVLCSIQYVLQTINPFSTFKIQLKNLLAQYQEIDVAAMGFPRDWETELFWQ